MGYTLAPDIAMCDAAGTLIFLDIRRDRYFRLAAALEAAVRDHMSAPVDASPGLDRAIERRALAWSNDPGARIVAASIAVPPSSAIDEVGPGAAGIIDFWSVGKATRAASARLRRMTFAEATRPPALSRRHVRPGTAPRLARAFNDARRLLPFSALCLRDSLALRAWLARCGCPATLVIGVIAAPFSAHCWLQDEACVLDEASDEVARYTPIWSVP